MSRPVRRSCSEGGKVELTKMRKVLVDCGMTSRSHRFACQVETGSDRPLVFTRMGSHVQNGKTILLPKEYAQKIAPILAFPVAGSGNRGRDPRGCRVYLHTPSENEVDECCR